MAQDSDRFSSAEQEAASPAMPSSSRRSHPVTPLIRAWLWLLAAGAWAVRSILEGDSDYQEALLVIVAAIVLGLGVGYVLWLFTWFVIDGTELRIDSGVLIKRSRRMPYERIQSVDIAQPLGARLFGLAELRIEMAGGQNSRTRLQFLTLAEAGRLRRTLLERSREDSVPPEDAPTTAEQPAQADRRVVVVVPPLRLIAALATSTDFLAQLFVTAVILVAMLISVLGIVFAGKDGVVAALVPVVLGIAGGIYSLVRLRVFEQWDFRLADGVNGLRVDRGLFGRISQSIPLDRVQGVVIEQRLLWRPFGWYRVRVDTAGYTRGSGVTTKESTSTLLPVGSIHDVARVVAAVLPGTDPLSIPTVRPPSRSAVLAPIGWRFRALGYDDRLVVVERGWVTHRIDVVPHAKTQSVRTKQGPLQRRLGLADVVVDTTKGPVYPYAQCRDHNEAWRFAITQLDRARSARTT